MIFQIGIARFISSRCVLSLCVYMSDDKVRLYESASSALESLRKSGLIRSETRFEPYSMWLAGKHGNDEVKRVQSLLSVSENNKGRPRCWASIVCSTSAVLPSKAPSSPAGCSILPVSTSSLSMGPSTTQRFICGTARPRGQGQWRGDRARSVRLPCCGDHRAWARSGSWRWRTGSFRTSP